MTELEKALASAAQAIKEAQHAVGSAYLALDECAWATENDLDRLERAQQAGRVAAYMTDLTNIGSDLRHMRRRAKEAAKKGGRS